MRKCCKCRCVKDDNEFFVKSPGRLQSYCKDCKRAYDREYHARRTSEAKLKKLEKQNRRLDRNRAWVYNHLRDKSCKDCGEVDIVVLTFDHLSNKSHSIADMIRNGFSLKNIRNEMDKCEIVCANCHMRRTAKQFNWHKRYYCY